MPFVRIAKFCYNKDKSFCDSIMHSCSLKQIRNVVYFGLSIALLFVFFAPTFVYAQTDFGTAAVSEQINLSGQDLVVSILKAINIALSFLGLILVIMIIYGGYLIMTSVGDQEKIDRGKLVIRNAVIGTVIILFSWIIVRFVINIMSDASGRTGRDDGDTPEFQDFSGIGGLGRIITAHYPLRNQTDVYRNTAVSITFRDSIDPSSVIDNTNGTCWAIDIDVGVEPNADSSNCRTSNGEVLEYFGDCIEVVENGQTSTSCDSLLIDSVRMTRIDGKGGSDIGTVFEADAAALYEGDEVHTFVFKPREFFGSDAVDEWHEVTVTNDLLVGGLGTQHLPANQKSSIFSSQIEAFYSWEFQTNTEVDVSPPYVVNVSPAPGETTYKNRVLSITFNEPVNPITTQGVLGADSVFTNVVVDLLKQTGESDDTTNTSLNVTGAWNITNAYKTIEFVSDEVCGVNNCGDDLYCLPTTCAEHDVECSVEYAVLARTATLKNQEGESFEAAGFDGVTDMASNALDSDEADKTESSVPGAFDFEIATWVDDADIPRRHRPPLVGDGKQLSAEEFHSDHFWWRFTVQNAIDARAPYISRINPGVDNGQVAPAESVNIHFSRQMHLDSLTAAALEEYPVSDDPFGYEYRSHTRDDGTAMVANPTGGKFLLPQSYTVFTLLPARPLGSVGQPFYYLPSIPSEVKADNQFCFYPSRGPASDIPQTGLSDPACIVGHDTDGTVLYVSEDCTPERSVTPDTDSGCANAVANDAYGTLDECIAALKTLSPTGQE